MGVYARFKRNPEGFRQLVELLESTPAVRRQKMIEVGMAEDPEYTKRALEFTLNFDDIMHLPDLELAEVLASMPGRLVGLAIHQAPDEIKKRFMEKAQPRVYAEIKEALELGNVSLAMIGSGQMKMIETARKLEKKGLVKAKKIPLRAQ